MKYLPSAKSPFWQILFSVQLFTLAYFLATGDFYLSSDTHSANLSISIGIIVTAALFPVTVLLGFIAVKTHNKTHPNDKLNVLQVRPPELNDNDERLTSLTARATRNVYLYHNTALPTLLVVLLFAQPSLSATILLLGLLTVGHYITYWIGIKPALED